MHEILKVDFKFLLFLVRPEATIPENHYVSKFGYSITLQCIVKNDSSNIVVYWLKGKSDVRSLQSSRYSGGNLLKPSLTIKNTNLNDAGVYTCKLDTSYGPSEDSVLLKVLCKLIIKKTIV